MEILSAASPDLDLPLSAACWLRTTVESPFALCDLGLEEETGRYWSAVAADLGLVVATAEFVAGMPDTGRGPQNIGPEGSDPEDTDPAAQAADQLAVGMTCWWFEVAILRLDLDE